MSRDLRSGPDRPPLDELDGAEQALRVLHQVVRSLSEDDQAAQTPCAEFDVAALTGHLVESIVTMGAAAGAEVERPDPSESVERQVILVARPALDAWHRRGLSGAVTIGPHEAPATVAAGILALELLVHAWDYAAATGRPFEAAEPLVDYVDAVARTIITPQGRRLVGFDDPVEVGDDAGAVERLLAFTGRRPV